MAQARAAQSDEELRSQLEKFGVRAGPITDTTRELYLGKLNKLKNSETTAKTSTTAATKSSTEASRSEVQAVTPPSTPPTPKQPSGLECSRLIAAAIPTTTSHPSTTTHVAPHYIPSQYVISQLLQSLNNASHLASDTAFLFPEGDVFLASRAILSTQCCDLIPLLYNREDPFAVNVTTVSGHTSKFFVRPSEFVADLKEKISLSEGVPVPDQRLILLSEGVRIPDQRLIFMQNELLNNTTITQAGIQEDSKLLLVVTSSTTPQQTSYFTSCVNPSLSVAHFSLGLGLEQLLPVNKSSPHLRPPRLPLPPHICHTVHVNDVPFHGWTVFIRYLYCRQLNKDTSLAINVCCYVLAEHFRVHSLSEEALSHIEAKLTVDSAARLLHYADSIQSQPLRAICMRCLKHSSVCIPKQ